MPAPIFQHEIENKPLRAEHGRLKLIGWCLAAGHSQRPDVRLTVGDSAHYTPTLRITRSDVVKSLDAAATAEECGFVIEAKIAAGAHWARLEASVDGVAWHTVKRLTLLATPDRLKIVIEKPVPEKKIEQSVRVMGWCAHPDYHLTGMWLHYGTQRVRCNTGLPRTDVPRFLPESPDATKAGFISEKNLPVGRGPLRAKAVATSGEVLLAETATFVEITQDEDHSEPFVLSDLRPDLGPARQAASANTAQQDARPLKILFVLYGDFTSNSAIHVANLANQLAACGHICTVAVPRHVETAAYFRHARFTAVDYDDALTHSTEIPFDIIHAWTSRENVRLFCQKLKIDQPEAQLLVHLEDNELHILELSLGRTVAELTTLPAAELDSLVPESLSHPRNSRRFLEQADGVTVILDALRVQVPAGKPTHTIWPAAEAHSYFFRPRPLPFRRALGWGDSHIVLFYHGNVHSSNRNEVRELYAAVLELNLRGKPCTLIRLGRDTCDFLGELAPRVGPHVMNLGLIEHHDHIAVLLSLADYFVQPGEPDPFNDLRFPSKLPEFFALGRPVILPRTNLGLLVRHGEDAWVLPRADATNIVNAIEQLHADPALMEKLSRGAIDFAAKNFSWANSASKLADFYHSLTGIASPASS